jgi:hypothetical protein
MELIGQSEPAELHRQPDREGHQIEPPAGEQADGGGERD